MGLAISRKVTVKRHPPLIPRTTPLYKDHTRNLFGERKHKPVFELGEKPLANGLSGKASITEAPDGTLYLHANAALSDVLIEIPLPYITKKTLPEFRDHLIELGIELSDLQHRASAVGAAPNRVQGLDKEVLRAGSAIKALDDTIRTLQHDVQSNGFRLPERGYQLPPSLDTIHRAEPIIANGFRGVRLPENASPDAIARWTRDGSSVGLTVTLFRYDSDRNLTELGIAFKDRELPRIPVAGRIQEKDALAIGSILEIYHLLHREPPTTHGAKSAEDTIRFYRQPLTPNNTAHTIIQGFNMVPSSVPSQLPNHQIILG